MVEDTTVDMAALEAAPLGAAVASVEAAVPSEVAVPVARDNSNCIILNFIQINTRMYFIF